MVSVPRCGEPPTGGVNRETPPVHDQPLFLQTLSRFAETLPTRYDLEAALSELIESVAAVLNLDAAGITIAEVGRLRAVTTATDLAWRLERDHPQHPCPSRDAYATGAMVRVTDVRVESARWPEFSTTARRLGVAGVAGISMRLADQTIGSLNLYSTVPRQWSDQDMAVAAVLADVATSYVVNASKVSQQEQLSAQLQEALDSRCVIEQAKGITAQQNAATMEQAYQRMRNHARNNNASMRAVAEAIVAVGLHV